MTSQLQAGVEELGYDDIGAAVTALLLRLGPVTIPAPPLPRHGTMARARMCACPECTAWVAMTPAERHLAINRRSYARLHRVSA